jgi:hypothetical protein
MKRTGIWLTLLAMAPMALRAQNLLMNGSFELPSMAGKGDLYSSQPGFTLPGWTYPPQATGLFPLCRWQSGRRRHPVSIAQTFATTPGHRWVFGCGTRWQSLAGVIWFS